MQGPVVATETSLAKSSGRNLRKQFQDFREYFSEFKHAEVLFATCASWFFYDLASYGIGLNQTLASF
jgi:PHS family inorganic phosphate transporter-like MFS transporter